MNRLVVIITFASTCLLLFVIKTQAADPPGLVNHQGRIAVDGINHDGPGFFKFSLVKDVGIGTESIIWHHDGTSTGSAEPASALNVSVTNGHYGVLLGSDNEIMPNVFADNDNVSLRIWFSTDGTIFEQLAPDRRISSVGYALSAASAISAESAASFSGEGITIAGGNIVIPYTTMTEGRIDQNENTLLHSYGLNNFFAGEGAGNLTNTGFGNTGIGKGALKNVTSGSRNSAFGRWALRENTTGERNTATGQEALRDNITGSENTATGRAAMFRNISGSWNTANGYDSLYNNTVGNFNTASGRLAMFQNIAGSSNVAFGEEALYSNTAGNENTAIGTDSLRSNTIGFENTAAGSNSLFSNTTGTMNTAIGYDSLESNQSGGYNTSLGWSSLWKNEDGNENVAIGAGSLRANTSGTGNVSVGSDSLFWNTSGGLNTALGKGALAFNTTAFRNTAIGADSLATNTGSRNIALGYGAGLALTSGNDNITIGHSGVAGEGSTIRIGDTGQTRAFLAGIRGVTTGVANAVPILIDSNGQLGTAGGSIDTDPENELQSWSNLPGIPAGFSDDVDNVDDADASPTNELQDWGNLPGIPAGFSDDIDNIDDADASPTNELQNWGNLPGIPAAFSDGTDDINDADASPTNEIQTLGISNNTLSLTSGGGTADLSSVGPWSSSGGDVSFTGGDVKVNVIELAAPTSSSGIIRSGSDTLIHSFGGTTSFFAGRSAGNLTQSGAEKNTGIGVGALNSLTDGDDNTAFGFRALEGNDSGINNTAAGVSALLVNTDGNDNTAFGRAALVQNQGGNANTAIGERALRGNVGGSFNVGVGFESLYNNTGSNNIAIGKSAGAALTSGASNIAIGSPGVAGEGGTIRLGTPATHTRAFVSGIRGVTPTQSDGLPVIIDSSGQLGTAASWQEATPKVWSGGPTARNNGQGWQTLTLETASLDTSSTCFSVAASGDVTIQQAGVYDFSLSALRGIDSDLPEIRISRTRSAVTTTEFTQTYGSSSISNPESNKFDHIGSYAVGDVVEIELFSATSGQVNYDAYTGNSGTRLQIRYLGPN